jgi:hypothetical protein
MSLIQYLKQVNQAISSQDGDTFGKLMKLTGKSPLTDKVQNDIKRIGDLSNFCNGKIDSEYRDVVPMHLIAYTNLKDRQYEEAFKYQITVANFFQSAFQNDTNWALPALNAIVLDLRILANLAENELKSKGKEGGKLEEATRIMLNIFRITHSDRSSDSTSKQWGTLYVVNNIFKIYFQLNTVNLCKNLIRSVESPGFPALTEFPVSQLVTYKFYVGKLDVFNGSYKKAAEGLSLAFRRCNRTSLKNKRLILIYLIPVRLHMGRVPKMSLLKKYKLMEFAKIIEAVRYGNIKLFEDAIEEQADFLRTKGVFLVVEKLRLIAYRNLFKRIFLLQGKADKISLKMATTLLTNLGIEMDIDELECILANLIYQGMIKGYLAHAHSYLVVSLKNTFPPISG